MALDRSLAVKGLNAPNRLLREGCDNLANLLDVFLRYMRGDVRPLWHSATTTRDENVLEDYCNEEELGACHTI
jgi:hypothetical protein